jgi:hypothetical protein
MGNNAFAHLKSPVEDAVRRYNQSRISEISGIKMRPVSVSRQQLGIPTVQFRSPALRSGGMYDVTLFNDTSNGRGVMGIQYKTRDGRIDNKFLNFEKDGKYLTYKELKELFHKYGDHLPQLLQVENIMENPDPEYEIKANNSSIASLDEVIKQEASTKTRAGEEVTTSLVIEN